MDFSSVIIILVLWLKHLKLFSNLLVLNYYKGLNKLYFFKIAHARRGINLVFYLSIAAPKTTRLLRLLSINYVSEYSLLKNLRRPRGTPATFLGWSPRTDRSGSRWRTSPTRSPSSATSSLRPWKCPGGWSKASSCNTLVIVSRYYEIIGFNGTFL